MTDRSRRRVLALTATAVGLAGCSGVGLPGDRTPTATPAPTVTAQPAEVIVDLSEGTIAPDAGASGTATTDGDADAGNLTYTRTRTDSVERGISVNYEAGRNGTYDHQVTVVLTREADAATADDTRASLVDQYREEHDATVESIAVGDTGSLVTFDDEAHAIVTYRNALVHVMSYGGSSSEAVAIARSQVDALRE